jgi:hypothetical protein
VSVPNHFSVVQDVFRIGSYDLKTHEGQARFVDDVVLALHKRDPRWGHLKKNPGQTQVHGHGEDSALYLAPMPGLSTSVDFIGGAGGPDPKPGWIVDEPRYSRTDWIDPTTHGEREQAPEPEPKPQPTPVPAHKPYPGDPFFQQLGALLEADYAEGGQRFNGGSVVWISRTLWRYLNEGMSIEASTAQSRKEWRAALGLP